MAAAISIREATMADLDTIIDVYLAAFPMDPVWNYVFSNHHQYPEETQRLTRLEYTHYLRKKDKKWRFMVAEMPKKDNKSVKVIAAISLWAFVDKVEDTGDGIDILEVGQDGELDKKHDPLENRLDANPARVKAYISAIAEAENMYHNMPYGENQIRLKLLATHPDYQRQGAASKLLNWGMCLAVANFKYLTVLAGPMGKKLYTKTCFYEQGTVDVQIEGEEEKVTFSAMFCNAI
ncbi:hypothetical protein MMC30_003425 [Trapelia coarctata]|nr:hypothetical protein [Trapelia coarctata]